MTNLSTFVATARRHLTPIIDRRGNILYSSGATLRPGTVYLLGLNPGGDPHDPRHQEQTIDSALRALPSKRENEYLDVSWREQGIRRAAVQPRLIIAFGNSGVSPYAFLLSKLTPASETMFPSGHGSWRCRAFTAGGMRVAGLPHLSRYAIDRHPPVGKWLNALLAG